MVRPFDGSTRFHVTSASRPDVAHLVDLIALQCLGRCTCEAFSFRSLPKAVDHCDRGEVPPAELRCKHILEAREYVLDLILGHLARQDPNDHDHK